MSCGGMLQSTIQAPVVHTVTVFRLVPALHALPASLHHLAKMKHLSNLSCRPQKLPFLSRSRCAGRGKPLTLVLMDVEGSVELWQWNAAAMAEARKLHDAILHSRLRHFHG